MVIMMNDDGVVCALSDSDKAQTIVTFYLTFTMCASVWIKLRFFLKYCGCGLYTGALNRPKITVIMNNDGVVCALSDSDKAQTTVTFYLTFTIHLHGHMLW